MIRHLGDNGMFESFVVLYRIAAKNAVQQLWKKTGRKEMSGWKTGNDDDDVNDKCCFCLDFGVIMCCHSMFDLLPLAYPH